METDRTDGDESNLHAFHKALGKDAPDALADMMDDDDSPTTVDTSDPDSDGDDDEGEEYDVDAMVAGVDLSSGAAMPTGPTEPVKELGVGGAGSTDVVADPPTTGQETLFGPNGGYHKSKK